MRKLFVTLLTAAALHAAAATDYTQWVDPFIGTTNFGTTNPGAVVPNGMMCVTPFNVTGSDSNMFDKDARWWSTPYDKRNSFFTGFAHGALSGVGCPDMGGLLTMATTGPLNPDYRSYGSAYAAEQASPGYYAARLTKYDILAEATATARTSVERYTFPGGEGNILLNLGQALTNESGATVRRVSATEIEGSKLFGTFCYNAQKVFPVYFVMRVSKVPSASGYWKMQPPMTGVEAEWTPDNGTYKIYREYGRDLSGDDIGYWFTYDSLAPGEQIEVRIGISYVSVDNARRNLDLEQKALTFDDVVADARRNWNADLGRIRVEGGTDEQRRVFYTALYHALIHPNLLSDVNGQYPLMESDANGHSDTPRYTVFSLWDTYRNLHQLLTLVYPERQLDMLRSMSAMAREWGWLPKWELYGRETFTMEGDPAIPVIVDSWRKGLRDFDIDSAYSAMKRSATTRGSENPMRPDIDPYLAKGYIPLGLYAADNSGDNSVSHALEYYVADAALAHLAAERGDAALADTLRRRSLGYRHYYSPETGTLRPLNADGTFLTPFNPLQGANFEEVPGFHEGTAWNYTFFVPHDVDGLAALMGGRERFVKQLQMVMDSALYDPANEPDIAYPYLFSRFPGEEWRTQKEVSRLLRNHFSVKPDGIPGNDDTGTMSAWAVFSMLGLYPDCPGEPFYTLTSPVFDSAEIDTPSGTIVISARRESPESIYIDSMTLGGSPLTSYRISHEDLIKGKTLQFNLTDRHGDLASLVDPLIGTGGHGHVFVGANVPFGMVQLGPTSFPETWDWCSGYHQSDSTVIGFSHTHMSGTGIGDLFDVTVMPVTGKVDYTREGMVSQADRTREVAQPGYYSVPLTRHGILAELTATAHSGMHRYTFPESADAALVFDLQNGGCWDKATEVKFTHVDSVRIEGYRFSKGWAPNQKVYFSAELSKPMTGFSLHGNDMYGRASFATAPGEQVLLKVGLSPVSEAGARANLIAEIPGWDFDSVRVAARAGWNRELGRVRAKAPSDSMLTKFYTGLYHSMFTPYVNSDLNGAYRGADDSIHSKSAPNYTLFSLWDTYRAEMPLLSVIQPERYTDMINSMVDIAEQQGRLPVWFFWGNETDCMVGNPGIIPVADAIVKKLPGVDRERAYKALLQTATDRSRGYGLRLDHGYIPSDSMKESIAYDMEFAIADAAIARAAEAMGDTLNARIFTERSHSYRNYLDPSTGFARGRMADGSWRTPFDPNSTNHRDDDYCEGNAWQYTWLVPHDLDGLIAFFGSPDSTLQHLDALFAADSQLTGDVVSPDITGLIGQYAHGNEPSHHVIYLYSMLGERNRAADLVTRVVNDFYTTKPDGIIGNEDAGQMSAWFILSSMGFYQVEPASGHYWFGAPQLSEVEIDLPGGTFRIVAEGLSADSRHIGSVTLDGRPYTLPYLRHSDIRPGSTLTFHMTH